MKKIISVLLSIFIFLSFSVISNGEELTECESDNSSVIIDTASDSRTILQLAAS